MSMEVRSIRSVFISLVIAGLVAAIPLVAGEYPDREANPPNEAGFEGYHAVVPERALPPYAPPESPYLNDVPTLTPENVSATLEPEESLFEDKVLHMPAYPVPPKADVVFVMDLTSSMSAEVDSMKANAIEIMQEIRALVPDTYFGVISHMDYPTFYQYCGYADTYGMGGDYPYSLDQALTGDMNAVQTAVNALVLGNGVDFPESYARALYECYADAGVGWRAGAKRFVIQFGDAIPHDCDVLSCTGGVQSTGQDPGRDGTLGNADDLLIMNVINGLVANNTCLIPLYSGDDDDYFDVWDCWAGMTGCSAFQIDPDGGVPGGVDIGSYIASAVGQEFGHINVLTLEVCDAAWAGWLVGVTPPSYTDIDLDSPQDFNFQIEVKVPADTDPGTYCFDVCAIGDGVEYARQHVCITVQHPDDCIHLDIGEIYGGPGDDVLVPIYIQDVTGWDIFAFEGEICWCDTPEGLIQFEGCEAGEVLDFSGWSMDCGNCSDFCVTVAGAGANPLIGGGVLFWLNFHISQNAKPGMCCEICFDWVNVYDPEKPLEVCTECGWVCIESCSISGSVYAWYCRYDPCCDWYRYRPIPGARMHLSDCNGALQTQLTDANGMYHFGDLAPMEICPYCVDIDFCPVPDALITAYDASLVLQHVVCDEGLDDCPFDVCGYRGELSEQTIYPQRVAANVNCSDMITAYDASLILQYVVEAIPAFPCPDPWAWFLLEQCGNCAPECPWVFDWVGVLIGDVSGPMAPPLGDMGEAVEAKVGIPRHYGNKVDVPLVVQKASGIVSIEMDVTYNLRDYSVVNVVSTGLCSSFMCGFNVKEDSVLIAMAGTTPIMGSGPVALITFQKKRPLIAMALPRVCLCDGMFNEGSPSMIIEEQEEGKEIWNIGPGLDAAAPNPFADQTTLKFHMSKAAHVMLAIYNVSGQLVRVLEDGEVAAGTHNVVWDGRDSAGAKAARGVYFCRMETAGFSATEKMVLLK
jgi:hypothetical protein